MIALLLFGASDFRVFERFAMLFKGLIWYFEVFFFFYYIAALGLTKYCIELLRFHKMPQMN